MRKDPLVQNEYYHIYNRGVDKRAVFLSSGDFDRFLLAMKLLNYEQEGLMHKWRDYKITYPQKNFSDFLSLYVKNEKKLVEIVAYCLNSNHFHFILKQVHENNGIKIFMQRLGNSYTKYFNDKNERTGALFQGRFKSARIKSAGQLSCMSIYVNCNCEIHGLAKAENYQWCGFPEYLGKTNEKVCSKSAVMGDFRKPRDYFDYAKEIIRDFRKTKEDEKTTLLE
ncbi:MAG: hypothetical protein A2359_05185 [Candidatus Moranbacteria bacterium RIFOXYB1_FULL_43_19]|nr:MAG: hypothetical protein A2359_05185 [Candidatus Moranbacteria bacterium RIFOXYB1_FULL_43_19]OGI28115.1 MAG: hypothetical protein A2184_02410 [Candidatus Moranbacteria bacterium RIFOXYA1_FULL_44_7]OGI34133.1 MAG: hypothetical protein A2420_04340 [Candidatus Moranbacteria bacterium RIFOXYC1_FULL_44_13]